MNVEYSSHLHTHTGGWDSAESLKIKRNDWIYNMSNNALIIETQWS